MVRTHYDNLQVTRNASDEVIRGAYKYLCQKWHPDRQPADKRAEAERIMKLVNTAYAVLSDPDSRKQHDEWIAEQEAAENVPPQPPPTQNTGPDRPLSGLSKEAREKYASSISLGTWPGALIGSVIVVVLGFALLSQWQWFAHFFDAHRVVMGFVIIGLIFSIAGQIVEYEKNSLLSKKDDDTLKILYDQSARRRMVLIISVVILVAGGVIAFAVLVGYVAKQDLAQEKSVITPPQPAPVPAPTPPVAKERDTLPGGEVVQRKTVSVNNDCGRPVTVVIAYKLSQEATWSSTSWDFDANSHYTSLSNEFGTLEISVNDAYWLAKSADGKLIWRASEGVEGKAFVDNGIVTDRFLPLRDSPGNTMQLTLTCES